MVQKPLTIFAKKLHHVYLRGFKLRLLAVFFLCIVKKITCEDTETEVHKYFFCRSFANFTGKTPVLEFLFKKIADPQACNFIKKRLQHMCFPVKFAKFLRAPFFTIHLRWLLCKISNINNPTICSQIFHQDPLCKTNL